MTSKIVAKLRYMAWRHTNGSVARGGNPGRHYLDEAADRIEELEAERSAPEGMVLVPRQTLAELVEDAVTFEPSLKNIAAVKIAREILAASPQAMPAPAVRCPTCNGDDMSKIVLPPPRASHGEYIMVSPATARARDLEVARVVLEAAAFYLRGADRHLTDLQISDQIRALEVSHAE